MRTASAHSTRATMPSSVQTYRALSPETANSKGPRRTGTGIPSSLRPRMPIALGSSPQRRATSSASPSSDHSRRMASSEAAPSAPTGLSSWRLVMPTASEPSRSLRHQRRLHRHRRHRRHLLHPHRHHRHRHLCHRARPTRATSSATDTASARLSDMSARAIALCTQLGTETAAPPGSTLATTVRATTRSMPRAALT